MLNLVFLHYSAQSETKIWSQNDPWSYEGQRVKQKLVKYCETEIGETEIGKILCKINPEAQRSNVGHRSLNAKVYNAKYVGHKIHYDQNKESGMFGVAHVCALDGFSGKIVGHNTMARKNNLLIYEEVFMLMITFFIYKDNVFWIFQIFWSFL